VVKHPFNQEKSEAVKKWLPSFLERHPAISMRTPEGISAAQVKGCTSEDVARFFDIYESERFLEYLSLSAVKDIEWFTYYMMLKKCIIIGSFALIITTNIMRPSPSMEANRRAVSKQ
jgi:hypothetical protein